MPLMASEKLTVTYLEDKAMEGIGVWGGVATCFAALLLGIFDSGQLFVMTTNHRDRLNPALIRNGRADLHVEFSYASDSQIAGMCPNRIARRPSQFFWVPAKVCAFLPKHRADVPRLCTQPAAESSWSHLGRGEQHFSKSASHEP